MNTECLNTKYGLSINHLVIAPGDPKACYPCSGAGCDQNNFWFSDAELTEPVFEGASSIFFKASSCNTRIESDGEFAEFTACFGSDTNSEELDGAIITWEMLPKRTDSKLGVFMVHGPNGTVHDGISKSSFDFIKVK